MFMWIKIVYFGNTQKKVKGKMEWWKVIPTWGIVPIVVKLDFPSMNLDRLFQEDGTSWWKDGEACLTCCHCFLFYFLIFSKFYYLLSFSIWCLFVPRKFNQSKEVCFLPLEMVSFGRTELIEILRPFFFFANGPFFKKRHEWERVFFFFANAFSLKTRFERSKE